MTRNKQLCIHWRCTKHYKLTCPTILKTKKESVIERKGSYAECLFALTELGKRFENAKV